MKEKTSALHSKYIIDGVSRQLTPAEMLDDCLASKEGGHAHGDEAYEPIVDESTDPSPSLRHFQDHDINAYLAKVLPLCREPRPFPMSFPESFTKGRIAQTLLEAIWLNGHFKLGDLAIAAKWHWYSRPIGNMAAFYASVEATADYTDGLGICLSGYSFTENSRSCQVTFKVGASERSEDFDQDEIFLPADAPFGSGHPFLGRHRALSDKLTADPDSWIIYIPFDSCDFRLGNSLLCDVLGQNGDNFPEIGDADYFIDCYEVVREFVEDKVAVSAITVSDGGLLTALKLMCSGDVGADIDISGIMNAYDEKDRVRILFSEIPGTVIQIKDADYDYVDAELLLQDIAYYPIGHPVPGSSYVKVKAAGVNGISSILQTLLGSQASEGED